MRLPSLRKMHSQQVEPFDMGDLHFVYDPTFYKPSSCPTSNSPSTSYSASYPREPPDKYFPPQRYVSVAVLHVFIGTVTIKEKPRNIPMVAYGLKFRVSLTDYRGMALLDTYVRPTHRVEDYRSAVTGLHSGILSSAPVFHDVQKRVAQLIKNKIIVGHCIWNSLSVLGVSHPALDTRDLALFVPFRKMLKSRTIVKLSNLVNLFMGRQLSPGYEDSLEVARACIDLFRSCEQAFESVIRAGSWPCDLPPSTYSQYYT